MLGNYWFKNQSPFSFSSKLRIIALSSSFSLLSAATIDNPVLEDGLPGEAGLPWSFVTLSSLSLKIAVLFLYRDINQNNSGYVNKWHINYLSLRVNHISMVVNIKNDLRLPYLEISAFKCLTSAAEIDSLSLAIRTCCCSLSIFPFNSSTCMQEKIKH